MYSQTVKKKINPTHRKNLSKALLGNKNGLGKNLGNKNALGKTVGEKNGHWKGGVSKPEYKEKIAGRAKPEVCEICRRKSTIDFDHDHATGDFRGWICRRCNLVLGMVKDDRRLLRLLAEYLDIHDDNTRPTIIININGLFPNNSDEESDGDEPSDTSNSGWDLSK